ncbi:hypothetical protein [Sphingomonas montana]|uniref:hypothetical protein n=1 Tax=Sphingomonas montana TaxID=1843236 RepID=UPI00096FAC76|nr:hypothetical protein [Sphingomonas montana]
MTPSTNAAAAMVASSPLPLSFAGDETLFAASLGGMTALMCLGIMLAGVNVLTIARTWRIDRWNHPVSIWRYAFALAGLATALRCGSEAMLLWSWSPQDAVTSARVIMAKRWVDLAAISCGVGWMTLFVLSRRQIEIHLQRRPLPLEVWEMIPALRRPALVVIWSFIMAIGVVWARG